MSICSGDGIVKIRKKMYHVNYANIAIVDYGPLPTGYKGVAFCRFNVMANAIVMLEAWVDKGENDNWKRVLSVVDNGARFGSGGTRCGGTDKQAGTWGFPCF
jgi:hypothetical protein